MKTRKWTQWVVIASTVALVLWDIFVVVEPTPKDSISRVIMDWATVHPMLTFAAGVLIGHWFWPQTWGE